jgi:hypothetical protein
MTESRKRRPPSRTVVRPDPDAPAPKDAAPLAKLPEKTLAFVVPPVKAMLDDAKAVVAYRLKELREEQSIGDTSGQQIRNLVASVNGIMDAEKKVLEGGSGLEGASPAELADALEAEAARIRSGGREGSE